MNFDLFYCNQAEMLLEKYEKLLEVSLKQSVTQSSLRSSMCGKWKNKMLMLFVAKLGIFRIQQGLFKSKSNLILFER